MLSNKDLRIGNFVNVPNKLQSPFRIDGFEFLTENGCKIFQKTGTSFCPPFGEIEKHPLTWYLKDLEPIPITEDWLMRFGFFIVNYNGIEATMPNKRYTIKSIKDYDGWFFCDGDTVLTNLEFIHTLQNLWFFMTTQELKINQ